jgi:hypothetical protein
MSDDSDDDHLQLQEWAEWEADDRRDEFESVRAQTKRGVDDDYRDDVVEVRVAGEMGLGVFCVSEKPIPAGIVLVAALGHEISNTESAMRTYDCYMMQLDSKQRVLSQFDKSVSSWTRYVNCANHDRSKQNVQFEEVNGVWYLVTIKEIRKGEQLLVW